MPIVQAEFVLDRRLDHRLFATIHGKPDERRLRVYATDIASYDRTRVGLRANRAHGLQRPMTES